MLLNIASICGSHKSHIPDKDSNGVLGKVYLSRVGFGRILDLIGKVLTAAL